jgi:hypothetical protein
MATATATKSTKPAVKRTRKPTPFNPSLRVTVSVHKEADFSTASVADTLGRAIEKAGFAVRVNQRARRKGSSGVGPQSAMVYVAPQGYEFASEKERGVRLNAETANLLRPIAEAAGITVDELIRKMAEQAAQNK